MAESRESSVQRVIESAESLANDVQFGQVVLVIHQGKVTRAEIQQKYVPAALSKPPAAAGAC